MFSAMGLCWGVISEEAESTAVGGSKPAPPHSGGFSNWWHQPHGPHVDPPLPGPLLVEHREPEKLSSLLYKPYPEPSSPSPGTRKIRCVPGGVLAVWKFWHAAQRQGQLSQNNRCTNEFLLNTM